MTTTRHTLHLLAAASLAAMGALATTGAMAQDGGYSYGGLSIGHSSATIDEEGITARHLQSIGAPAVTGITRDDRDTSYRLFLGYQINRNVGLEAGFFNLGKYNFRATTNPAGQLNGELKIQGLALDVVGTVPFTDNFSGLARLGVQYAKSRGIYSGTGAVLINNPQPSARQANVKAGLGLQYQFSPNFMMRAEAEQYRVRDADGSHINVQVYSVSAVFPFGDGARSSSRSAFVPAVYKPVAYASPVQPEVVAVAAPAPAPIMMDATPRMAPVAIQAKRRVSFSSESLFDYDVSSLRPEGKAALDTFARDMAGTTFEVVVVEGHADRTGTQAYNQALSQRRADTVKSYLVNSAGFDANKVSTAGLGESAPSTQPGDCNASLSQAELRRCLQPDRRVDVEVKGTR